MKRSVWIIIIGVCSGLIMVFFKNILQIDMNGFIRMHWPVAIGIIFVVALISGAYNIFYQRKLKKAIKLFEQGETQKYITELQTMLKTAKGRNLRTVLSLDLAAGYVEAKEFQSAIPILEELSQKRLANSSVTAASGINLFLSYFGTEQYEKALALYEENQKLFDQYRGSKAFGESIAILDIFVAIQLQQFEQAKTLLESAKKTYDAPRFQKDLSEVSERLASAEKQYQEL